MFDLAAPPDAAKRPIRSYALRQKHLSPAQSRALERHWPRYGLNADRAFAPDRVFGRSAPLALEIGFGNGEHLLRRASEHPGTDFVGIEVWPPGIGTLLRQAAAAEARNLRVVRADAREYIRKRLPDASLDIVWILFPDPWPKKRHHKRRLVNADFLDLIAMKMKPGASLHLATDWAHYAAAMREAAAACARLDAESACGVRGVRTGETRFERRGARAGRAIDNLSLRRVADGAGERI